MRARKPTYGHLLFRIYERLDAIEQRLSALSAEQLSENEEILDTRKMRLLSKRSDRTLLRRRNDGTLPYFRRGGKIYYVKSKVLRALEKHESNQHR